MITEKGGEEFFKGEKLETELWLEQDGLSGHPWIYKDFVWYLILHFSEDVPGTFYSRISSKLHEAWVKVPERSSKAAEGIQISTNVTGTN